MAITFPRLSGLACRQIILWSIFLTLIGCKSTKIESIWTAQPMHIDSSAADWHNLPLTFFEDERLSVGFANDSSNLYVLLRTSNLEFIRGVRRAGITLWLDAKGGKDKTRGVFYQGGPDPKAMEKAGLVDHTMHAARIGDRPFMRNMPSDSMPQSRFEYIDESYYLEKNIDPDGTFGPAMAVGIEDGFCVYELMIPLTDKPPEIYGMSAQPGQEISIGAEWQEMGTNEFRGRPPGGRGGHPEGGGGGFPGGGFRQDDTPFGGGGMRPGGMGEGHRAGPSMDKKDIWIKVQLAMPSTAGQQ
jgi:hypothetical protein